MSGPLNAVDVDVVGPSAVRVSGHHVQGVRDFSEGASDFSNGSSGLCVRCAGGLSGQRRDSSVNPESHSSEGPESRSSEGPESRSSGLPETERETGSCVGGTKSPVRESEGSSKRPAPDR